MNLSDLQKLCDEATPGPWSDEAYTCKCCHFIGVCKGCDGAILGASILTESPTYPQGDNSIMYASNGHPCVGPSDAAFIAAARTYLPKLIKVAEAARNTLRLSNEYFDDEGAHFERAELATALAELESE